MFGNGAKTETPLIIVCDEKDMVYANYLIQLIGQKGLFEYYAYVLPSQSELAITQQELTGEMFFFLD